MAMMLDAHRDQIRKHLVLDEGLKLSAYQDSLGYWTIGVGRLIDARKGGGITALEAYDLLDHDLDTAIVGLVSRYPWVDQIDPVRQAVLVELAFNMGHATLASFVSTLAAFQRQDWLDVSRGLRQSRWYTQVQKSRSTRLLNMVLTGEWPHV